MILLRFLLVLSLIIVGVKAFLVGLDSCDRLIGKRFSWVIIAVLFGLLAFVPLAKAQEITSQATVEYTNKKSITLEWTQALSPDFAGWRFYHTFGDPNHADYELLKEILYDPNFQKYDVNVTLNQIGYKRIFVKCLAFDASNVACSMIYFSPEKPFIVRMIVKN